MSALFAALQFPSDRQERGSDPGPYKEHSYYRPHLQRVFRRKCVYCRISDGLAKQAFGVDHYLPKSKFPNLAVAWPNLFYACNICNTWKGESVSTAQLFLPNPCEHRMCDHIQYSGANLSTYTSHGAWLAELLHLAERRELREFILAALGNFLKVRRELVDDLTLFEHRLDGAREDKEKALLQTAIRDTNDEIAGVDRHIERLIGEPPNLGTNVAAPDQER